MIGVEAGDQDSGLADLGTTMGYAAIYSEDVISHHRAFIARRRALRPGEEYRDLTPEEWDQFLHHPVRTPQGRTRGLHQRLRHPMCS